MVCVDGISNPAGRDVIIRIYCNTNSALTQMRKAAFHNLGCKVNSYETDVMIQAFKEAGYEIVPFESAADVYVVNTCTVTAIADRKSRQMLHRAKKLNPGALVVAVGCYVETDRAKLEADGAVDLLVGNNRKSRIVELVEEALTRGTREIMDREVAELSGHPEYERMTLISPGQTRAYVKIQDGCNQFCTYCIIPYARGRIRSRESADILEEVRGLAERGIKEIVLTGIHISSYGMDLDPERRSRLIDLIEALDVVPGIERIRLGSLEPRILTEDFVARLAALPRVCPHFHLSLQSGSSATLARMRRQYTAEDFREGVRRLRAAYDRPALTADVIVGFPGETEEEFAETYAFLKEIDFYEIHVFRYSKRRGTPAAVMPDQVPDSVKAERSDLLEALIRERAGAYRRSFAGERAEVLLEEETGLKELYRRTQSELAAGKAGPEEQETGFAGIPEDGRFWIGRTARYVQVLAACPDAEAGMTVRGILREGPAGLPCLVLEPEKE